MRTIYEQSQASRQPRGEFGSEVKPSRPPCSNLISKSAQLGQSTPEQQPQPVGSLVCTPRLANELRAKPVNFLRSRSPSSIQLHHSSTALWTSDLINAYYIWKSINSELFKSSSCFTTSLVASCPCCNSEQNSLLKPQQVDWSQRNEQSSCF